MPPKPPVRSKTASSARKALLTLALLGATALSVGTLYHAMTGGARVDPSKVLPLDPVTATAHGFPGRAAQQAELDASCQIPGTVAVEKQFNDLSELQEYGGPFTRGALAYAKGASLYTCYYNAPEYASTYEPGAGIVRIHDTGVAPGRMSQDIHATLHGYQAIEGHTANDGTWNLYSRVMQKLTDEAVAYTGEFVAATEMNERGDDTLARYQEKNGTDGWAAFRDTYNSTKDIRAAATASVNALLRTPGFVSYHASDAIDAYYADWAQGRIDADAGIKFTAADAAAMGRTPGGVHLADGIVLPSQDELQKIAPDTAPAFATLVPAGQGRPYAQQLAAKMKDSGFTALQAITRVDSDLTGKFNYTNRANIGGVQKNCAQSDFRYAQVPDATKDLWQNMQAMRQGEAIGSKLYDFTKSANIYFCYFTLDKTEAGEWNDNDGIVRVADRGMPSQDNALTIQGHEIIHGIQRLTGVEAINPNWTIGEYQLMNLAFEDAARTGQLVIALDLAKAGNEGPLKDALSRYPEAKPAKAAYDAAIGQNKTHREALQAAGAAGWAAHFGDRYWADSYNNRILAAFVQDVVSGAAAVPNGATYSLDTARKTGWISEDFNFTATIPALPPYEQRFGGNVQMRQAFDYVWVEHLGYRLGRNDPQYKAGLQQLLKENNPYVGVDLKVIDSTLRAPGTTLTSLEAMDCFSGRAKGCTYGGQKLDPDQFKMKIS